MIFRTCSRENQLQLFYMEALPVRKIVWQRNRKRAVPKSGDMIGMHRVHRYAQKRKNCRLAPASGPVWSAHGHIFGRKQRPFGWEKIALLGYAANQCTVSLTFSVMTQNEFLFCKAEEWYEKKKAARQKRREAWHPFAPTDWSAGSRQSVFENDFSNILWKCIKAE